MLTMFIPLTTLDLKKWITNADNKISLEKSLS